MKKNFNANPTLAPTYTKPGESKEYVGTRNITDLLPVVFQTTVNKKFLESTLEQLMSSGSLQAINNYVGERTANIKNTDQYLDPTRSDNSFQFVPSAINTDADKNITNALTYDDFVNALEFNEAQLNNHNNAFNELGYTLDLPINYDMFTNHHRYFWILNTLPVCELVATDTNTITIDDIANEIYYTTPVLNNGKTLELQNGMRIRFAPVAKDVTTQTVSGNTAFTSTVTSPSVLKVFLNNEIQTQGTDYTASGNTITFTTAPAVDDEIEIWSYWADGTDYAVDDVYIVDGVGSTNGIQLTKQFDNFDATSPVESYGKRVWFNSTIYGEKIPSQFDANDDSFDYKPFDISEHGLLQRDYTVEERYSQDQSAWARSNLWVHEQVAEAVCAYTETDASLYLLDTARAVRPIIEFRANIEKYNFGYRHLTYVNHAFNTISSPGTAIEGKTSFSFAEFMVNGNDWQQRGYQTGDLVRVVKGSSNITYWECKETHTSALDPTHYENQKYWQNIIAEELENDDLVLISCADSGSYRDKIYRVSGVGTSITLTEVYNFDGSGGATQIRENDKIVVLTGHNIIFKPNVGDELIFSGSEWYWGGDGWVYGQQKDYASEEILFDLFDINQIQLDFSQIYPNSSFNGDYIFRFGRGTGRVDEALGFAPRYVDYGNNPGLEFDLGLGAVRYQYNKINQNSTLTTDGSVIENIDGFYYYKTLDTELYYNGWKEVRNGQPVQLHQQFEIVQPQGELVVNLGTIDINTDDVINFGLFNNRLSVETASTLNSKTKYTSISGSNPVLFMSRNRTYTVQTEFDVTDLEIVNFDGTAASNVTNVAVDNRTFTFTIDTANTDRVLRYRLISDNSVTGLIYIDDNTDHTTVSVLRNGVQDYNYSINGQILTTTAYAVGDTIDVYWSTQGEIKNTTGEFLAAESHTMNPQNAWLTSVSYGDLQQHLKEQVTNIPTFTGDYFGRNNYKEIPHVHEFGGTIRKQPFSTEIAAQSLMDTDTNFYSSLKYVSQNYRRFIEGFLQKVAQLHKSTNDQVPTYALVDRALHELNLGKSKTQPFSNSNMVHYRDYEQENYTFDSSMPVVFSLPQTVNTYNDTRNHVQAWLYDIDGNGNQTYRNLIKGVDYTITNNKLTLLTTVNYDSNGQAEIYIRWYPIDTVSYVPPSAAKLGLVRPQRPSIVSNVDRTSTGDFTNRVMVMHDGSYHDMAGTELYDRNAAGYSVQDAALWELETRIYNNLNSNLNTVIDYKEIMPNASRYTVHSWQDLTIALAPEFNKWKTRRSITALQDSSYYNPLNKFTWNYNSVYPNIGGYKGIYVFFFNTETPQTTPWEMFGYNQKPTWWDTYYSWTDATKRTALILALKYGHYNNPSETVKKYNKAYSYNAYDWDNDTLVTAAGVLNDPVTANVVTAPSGYNASLDFVFGDYGPVEAVWRNSTEYKTELLIGLARLRPLWVTNTFFNSTSRRVLDTPDFNSTQIIDSKHNQLTSINTVDVSNTAYDNSIIEYVKVTNGGSGYTSAPVVSVFSNFGSSATIELTVENETITSASIVSPGSNYQSKPIITVETGGAEFEPVLLDGAKKYYVGINNAISEWAINNLKSPEEIKTRFENLKFAPTIRTGGFINPNNQQLILESSQDKGRVVIPEENYASILHTSQPSGELFYGAIDLTKTESGVVVNGYDNNKQVFTYRLPIKSTKKTILTVDNERIEKFKLFESYDLTLDYNTEIVGLQSLYDFISGYANKLNDDGWTDNWDNAAARAVEWASEAAVGETYSVIPNVREISIVDNDTGYFDNVNKKYDGVYNLLDQNHRQITSNRVIVIRDTVDQQDPTTTISIRETGTAIYGVRLYKVNVEHLLVVDNTTDFDDVIYDPALGQRHKRIIWRGARTKNWNGRMFAPGYLVDSSTIVNNFDTTAREIDQYYGPGNAINNQQFVDTARFNIGYNKPDWSLQTDLDDDTVFNFSKGSLKYRGTRFAVDAFVRNSDLFNNGASVDLHEEWAIRTSDYGDIRSRDTVEFQLTPELVTTNPQPVRFTDGEQNDVLTDLTVDVDRNSNLLVTGSLSDVFDTRAAKTYNFGTISEEEQFASDFVTAGLPITSETDYRILNRQDFTSFPEEVKDGYSFSGNWQSIEQWDNKTSYKYKDRVIYEGRVWEMLDPDGSSGLNRPNDPITITGTISLPIVPSSSQTLIIDGNTINIGNSASTTTFEIIQITGTKDIATTASVPNGSTLVLGETSADAVTVQFSNVINTTVYQDVIKVGTVINPTIQASSSAQLTIENTNIDFDDTVPSTENITANTAFTDAFAIATDANAITINGLSSARIAAIENLRVAYQAATSIASWNLFLDSYFASGHGPNVSVLLAELATAPAYSTELEAFITHDVNVINEILNRSYSAANVISGTETVSTADETSARSEFAQGQYVDDVSTWLENNLTTILQTSTVVATASGTQFTTYDLQDIVDKINAAGIPRITASIQDDRLKITKASNNSTERFSLTINSASSNSAVGFATATETANSTGSIVTSTPNLTINQVVDQINAAQINGVSARISQANTNYLQIISNNDSLYIGNGNVNSIIGITQGVTLASTSISVTATTSALNDIIDSINGANVPGVTASSSNNKLRLTSTNPTMVIGAGTANTSIGITSQTYTATTTTVSNVFNAIVGSDGNQVFREMDNDPNIFSMWIAENRDEYSANSGYAVMQTMDFDFYITKACAGINDADEAQIVIARPAGNTQFHNLQENDYVLIRGSNTVPSIDGIHRVTKVDTDNNKTFYIDEYIEKEGDVGNVYPIRNMRFSNYNQLLNQYNIKVNGVYKYNFADVRQNDTRKPIYAFVDNDGTTRGAVYKWTGTWSDSTGHTGDTGWVKVRNNFEQARNDLINNIRIYDAKRKSLITTIETFDPAKGILPGFLSNEIDFKTTADVAGYNFNSISGSYENTKSWDDKQVGTRWWDLTTSIYFDYEQGSLDYQQNNWGRLFDGASVDIYEWISSPVLPEQWEELVKLKTVINGEVASGEVYSKTIDGETVYNWSEKTIYNQKTKQSSTVYYYWVKNQINFNGQRNYNTKQLSTLLADPKNFNISWCAASGSNNLLLSNVIGFLDKDTVVQINKKYDSNGLDLEEWTLLSENDADSVIPEYFHIKIRDSLAGYDNSTLVYNYTTYSSTTNYAAKDVVLDNGLYYICLVDNTIGVDPAADTAMTNWKQLYDYSIVNETLHDDIEVLSNQMVPDLDLHPYNRYGHLKRPRQSLYRDLVEARQNFVTAANNILKDICIVDEIIGWDAKFKQDFVEGTVTYEIDKFWTFTDWVERTYSTSGALLSEFSTNEVADYSVGRSTELASVVEPDQLQNGMTVYVRESIGIDGKNRPEIYMYDNLEWKLVWKKNGTIKLSEELWNASKYGHGFDAIGFDVSGFDSGPSNVLVKLFDILYNDIFVGQYKTMYNRLWFACLHQAVTQNTTDDFAFKTTYVKLQLNKSLSVSEEKYKETNIGILEEYFNDIKPYHTKLRSSIESNTFGELVGMGIDEQSRNAVITMRYNDHSMADWAAGDTILQGGTFAEEPVNVDASEFTTVDNSLEYIYNGNKFIHPNYEGWGEELYPADFTENIRIRVQTNASGSNETADTRTFQINILEQHDIEESIVVAQSTTALIQTAVSTTDTDIELADASMLYQPVEGVRGVVWIGTERVTYGAIENNTLRYCNRGSYATAVQDHAAGTSVIDATLKIPTPANFAHYGDGLRLAYNDSGVSLSSAGTTPEHAFIRNAGFGTL